MRGVNRDSKEEWRVHVHVNETEREREKERERVFFMHFTLLAAALIASNLSI